MSGQAPGSKVREYLIERYRLASIDLCLRFFDGGVEARAIVIIQFIPIVYDEQPKLGIVRQIDGVFDNDASAADPRAQCQGHEGTVPRGRLGASVGAKSGDSAPRRATRRHGRRTMSVAVSTSATPGPGPHRQSRRQRWACSAEAVLGGCRRLLWSKRAAVRARVEARSRVPGS